MKNSIITICLTFLTLFAFGQEMADVQMKTTQVRGNVYMLEGRGGNIGVISGADGAAIVDDQFAPLTDKIKAAVKAISGQDIIYVINTHWHGDHAGGNANLAESGSTIVAHENVRVRLSSEQYNAFWDRTTPASPESAWPVITFNDKMTIHFADEDISIIHQFDGHTDGDAIIKFEKANVVHAGDSFVTYGYPYIDASAGGTLQGLIDNAGLIASMCDENTIVIPGHGPLSKKEDVLWFQERLMSIQSTIAKGVEAGKSAEDMINDNLLSEFADWDGGFIKAKDFIMISYPELAGSK